MNKLRYIRQRENGNWQVRIDRPGVTFRATTVSQEDAVTARNDFLGYDPDAGTMQPRAPRILLLDIETTPLEIYAWEIGDIHVGFTQIKKDWELLCFAWKWLGEQDIHIMTRQNHTEKELAARLYDLLNSADVVVAHNGKSFDLKKINVKLLLYGHKRPHPYRVVDTLQISRKHFRFTSNKQDYLNKLFGGPGKVEHEGLGLWLKCIDNNPEAWALMIAYNKRDVEDLEQDYLMLRNWDGSHPNLALYYDEDAQQRCPVCGYTEYECIEPVYTQVSEFPAYRCKCCGGVYRATKRLAGVQTTGVV
ncbi:MAG: ribonuclease H-like domain-containing protein [Gammaproteobacteria bacterium]|uniref:Putative RNase_H superfamily protein n=1 Tax=viral metagenome TaxID=1070528 RepID=A0A6M3L9F2_9ZZZZ|nr:ribonuclease H-like domain-containing protein [Gammaproteobacteria bacterium]